MASRLAFRAASLAATFLLAIPVACTDEAAESDLGPDLGPAVDADSGPADPGPENPGEDPCGCGFDPGPDDGAAMTDDADAGDAPATDLASDLATDAPVDAPPDTPDEAPCDPPTAWGPASKFVTLACPADLATSQSTCHDFTGDGLGDHGFRATCGQIVSAIAPPEETGAPLALELPGVTDVQSATAFALALLPLQSGIEPPLPDGEALLAPWAYGACGPQLEFPAATIKAGQLAAGPSDLVLPLALEGLGTFPFALRDVRVTGRILEGGGPAGFEVRDGVMTGILLKQTIDALFAAMDAACDSAPEGSKPSWCQYVSIVSGPLAMGMDLHREDDGSYVPKSLEKPANAGSLCYTFEGGAIRITGIAVGE